LVADCFSEEHGGVDPTELKRLGISPKKLIDFSVNSNPFGPSPLVLEAIRNVDVSKYPDRFYAELKNRLADLNKIDAHHILVGNGTAELIWLVAQALLKTGDIVLILGPTFGEYYRASVAFGAQVMEIRAESPNFKPPVAALIEKIQKTDPRLVFLCNPNNPTGQVISKDDLQKILGVCKGQTLLVLDEAYRSFAGESFFGEMGNENCVILRSMTKDFALAGVRLGYSIAKPEFVDRLLQFQPSWSVNAFAQAAGLAVLSELPYYEKTLRDLKLLRDEFFKQLESINQTLIQSSTHFVLIRTSGEARLARRWFLQRSIQVRDCVSFGLPEFIRISTQLQADNLAFLREYRKMIHES
jgi:histidinol-phosphate aminotransferase